MKPIFREVNLAHHIGRAIHLIDAHCQEVVGQGKKYNPDIDYLCMGSNTGLLHTFDIEDNDKVVGYAVFMIAKDFITSERSAFNVAIYVSPEYRGRTAVRFMQYTEMMLLSKGIKQINFHVPPSSMAEKCLAHLGYNLREKVYYKEF